MRTAREAALEEILRVALSDMEDMHAPTCAAADTVEILPDGGCEVWESNEPCDCWQARARLALADAPASIQPGVGRGDGEECGNPICNRDSSTYHANGTGVCTRSGCQCMGFVPTGRPNMRAR